MMITRETDYAIRILNKLQDGKQYSANEISKSEAVPKPFAYKILAKLADAGIINVYAGHMGGYRLVADLNTLSMYDLLKAINSTVYLNHHTAINDGTGLYALHDNLKVIEDSVDDMFKKLSLQELVAS